MGSWEGGFSRGAWCIGTGYRLRINVCIMMKAVDGIELRGEMMGDGT